MIQLVPQLRILLACEPVDFRKGIDLLAALCKGRLSEDPMSGVVIVFRNRSGTALKLLTYDGVSLLVMPETPLAQDNSVVAQHRQTNPFASSAGTRGSSL